MAHKGLEARHASKSDLCKKLEEKRAAKAELASQLGAGVDALKQECSGLRTQLSVLQESHDRQAAATPNLLYTGLCSQSDPGSSNAFAVLNGSRERTLVSKCKTEAKLQEAQLLDITMMI